MLFDSLGLPKDTGASDLQDSARLAGVMVTFGYDVPVEKYVLLDKKQYVRHPLEVIYDFSRDQAICLMAGLYFKGHHSLVDRNFVTGKDIFSPSAQGHVARCQGKKANLFQNMWLKLDILYHAYVTPNAESNQLLCMLMVAGPSYVKYWLHHHPNWKKSITDYWCNWRQEFELADKMIAVLEEIERR